jgi:hypothetical protein
LSVIESDPKTSYFHRYSEFLLGFTKRSIDDSLASLHSAARYGPKMSSLPMPFDEREFSLTNDQHAGSLNLHVINDGLQTTSARRNL